MNTQIKQTTKLTLVQNNRPHVKTGVRGKILLSLIKESGGSITLKTLHKKHGGYPTRPAVGKLIDAGLIKAA
ncbi:MAG: hypothetical protein AABY01_03010 [Nanoarchaeota archaeon]